MVRAFLKRVSALESKKWQRRNAWLNDTLSRECANGVSNKKIGEKYQISTSTVERQLHKNHEKLLCEQLRYPCPQVMGIDEHSIHRGRTSYSDDYGRSLGYSEREGRGEIRYYDPMGRLRGKSVREGRKVKFYDDYGRYIGYSEAR